MLLGCGTDGGTLLLIGLPLIHFIRDLETANTFANALMHSFPVKAIKDTVNIALNTFGKVGR